jgi:DNA-directed RNA polymerase sigma subunit (sigma70/sigma32)
MAANMDISDRFKNILSGMESKDAELLREIIGRSVDALQNEESEEELRKKFEETRKRIKKIEAKALRKLEQRKKIPFAVFVCLN